MALSMQDKFKLKSIENEISISNSEEISRKILNIFELEAKLNAVFIFHFRNREIKIWMFILSLYALVSVYELKDGYYYLLRSEFCKSFMFLGCIIIL